MEPAWSADRQLEWQEWSGLGLSRNFTRQCDLDAPRNQFTVVLERVGRVYRGSIRCGAAGAAAFIQAYDSIPIFRLLLSTTVRYCSWPGSMFVCVATMLSYGNK